MSDLVRKLGTVTGVHGTGVPVGVDHDCVTVGDVALDTAQQEEFAQWYVLACHEAAANAERMRLDAAMDAEAMQAQTADAHGPHKCSFPCNPPGGTFWNPGPCTTCGKPYAVAQAERELAEAQAALDAARID